MNPAVQITALICGVLIVLGELAAVYFLARRSSEGEIGCLPFIALAFGATIAVALIVTGVSGQPATNLIWGV